MDVLTSRSSSHYSASSSSRQQVVPVQHELARSCHAHLPRGRRRIVARALFDPPPFKPEKLSVRYTPCASIGDTIPNARRYTLTHNDITGALKLTVGSEYNYKQISSFYTRLLRDEVIAEWKFNPNPSLHIYCHVSGEERWLAPPMLRNYIFRREIPLVLETFLYADKQLLALQPHLAQAPVYIHFESTEQELDTVELWGALGERSTWQPIPTSVLKRLLLALAGIKVHPQPPTQPGRTARHLARQQPATITAQPVIPASRPLPVVAALDVQSANSMASSDTTDSIPQDAGQPQSDSGWPPETDSVAPVSQEPLQLPAGTSVSSSTRRERLDVVAITCSSAAAAASAPLLSQSGIMAATTELMAGRMPQACHAGRMPAKRH